MKLQLSIRDTGMGRSIRFLLFGTFLVLVCITVSGTSWLQAHEGYSDAIQVSFPNHAQAQHAKNVAIIAARQDPDVRAAFLKARETGAPEDLAKARALLARTERAIFRKTAHMRASGVGWGEIARHYGVHPGELGLGHWKRKAQWGPRSQLHAYRRPHPSSETTRVSFPNHAQARHAKNVAISVARKDPEVRRAFWRARETGDPQDFAHAKALLARKAKGINREIVNMRDSGSGWGEIAAYYRVHPGVIGLGHSKTEDHHGSRALIQKRRPMETPEAKTRGFKGDWEKGNGNGRVVGHRSRNGHGNANGKGHGSGNGHGKGKK